MSDRGYEILSIDDLDRYPTTQGSQILRPLRRRIGFRPFGVNVWVGEAAGDHVIAVIGEQVSDAYLRELREDGVSYLFAGGDGRDLHRALDTLRRDFGIKTLLLEGGGHINGAFLKADLIDEISVLVYPGIDGLAGVSSIFEYVGARDDQPAAGRSLRHIATTALEGGMVWLRYQVEPAPRD